MANRVLMAVLMADGLVVGVFWAVNGQRGAAMLMFALVALVALAMFAAVNRTTETRAT
jgi:hypothetical protein